MRIFSALVLTAGLSACATSGGSPKSTDDGKISAVAIQGDLKSYEYTLPNGLTVVLTPNTKAPTTSIYHWVKVGSLNETPGITGIAHLFEHMMFRPLTKDAPNFDTLVRPLGGDINANTRYGATVYTTTVSNGKLNEALKLESDRFQKLVVSDELLKVEREAVRSEYSMGIDSKPMMDLWFTLFQKGFPGHPYGWTIVGDRADLDKINAKDCNTFFQKYYKPNNIGLFIAGDFTLDEAKAWVDQYYGGWQRGEAVKAPPPFKNKGTIRAEGKLASQAQNILLGYRLEDLTGENFTLFTLADHVLAGSSNSLASKRLVDKEKIAAGVGGFNTNYDFGLSEFLVVVNPGHTYDEAINSFSALGDDLEKLSDEEYQAYLAEYQISRAEAAMRNTSLNDMLATYWGKYGSVETLQRTLAKPPTISKADLTAYVRKLLAKDNLIAVTSKKAKG
ncbi:MAG: pitrilysin family protein [Bdellovibrionota bacterium]|nr:MAG: insulinase family protein [Pseudomonadota bacterium]